MRQVNRDEVLWLMEYGLQTLPRSVIKMLADPRAETQRQGRQIAARGLAKMLDRLELLSSAPEPPPFRTEESGVRSGVPPVEG